MSSVIFFFLFSFRCFSSQFTQPSPLQNLPCSGWPGPCSLEGRASPPRPPALRPPSSAAWAAPRRRVALSRAGSPLRGRGPGRVWALGSSAPLRPAGDSSRGHSNRLSGAPGGRFQSVPFLRRPAQGLRFSRRTRQRAPEAGSTGGDNPGAAETLAHLLLQTIGSAVFRGGLAPRSRVVVAARWGRPASPRARPSEGPRSGQGEGLPRQSACGSPARLLGHHLGLSFPLRSTPALGSGAWPVLVGRVAGRAGAPSPGLDASCSLDLNV